MSGTILLADDSLTIQKVVELTFADTDYRVVAVSNGDELLDRLGESQPNLIICDVIMPGRDGYDVCQQIKSSSEWLHLPVILLTGTFEPFDRDRAIAAGCSEIITKPFEARKLVDTVERLIGSAEIQTPQAADDSPSVAAEGETWPEEATPVDPPPPEEAVEEFGTQLSAPAAEEAPATGDSGIEFTTSGFAEMEEAGRAPSDESKPDSGIEYEFGDADTDENEQTTPLAGPEPAPPEDISAQTVRIDVSSFAEEEEAPVEDVPPVAEVVPPAVEPAPPETAPDASAETAPGPFESGATEPVEAPNDDEGEDEEKTEGVFKDESSMADTSPVDPPPEDSESEVEITPSGEGFQLTEKDIDRIARRVVDLAADRLDQIAWEVVPDMAEIVVRQRIRELEAESETPPPDPVQ